jgi:hypothetical protein
MLGAKMSTERKASAPTVPVNVNDWNSSPLNVKTEVLVMSTPLTDRVRTRSASIFTKILSILHGSGTRAVGAQS